MQSVHITTNFVSSNPDECEAYLIQHYVIKCVCNFVTAGRWFSPSSPVFSTNKTDCML